MTLLPSIAVIETTAIVTDSKASTHSLQLLNVIVQTESYVLSLVRYIPDFVEFDQLIKCHYHKVKIPFPVLDQQKQIRKRNTSTKAKRRSSLRQLFTSLHHHHGHHSKKKTNAEKVELYLQQCLLDPVVSQSTIVRDFLSIQRDEDQKLPTKTSALEDIDNNTTTCPDLKIPVVAPLTTPPSTLTQPDHDDDVLDATTNPSTNEEEDQQLTTTTNQKHSPSAQQHNDTNKGKDDDDAQLVPRPLSVKDDMVSLRDLLRDSVSPPPIPVMESPHQISPPTTAPDYQLQDEVFVSQPFPLEYFDMMTVLGKGCMGKVFLVKSTVNHQLYALKSIVKDLVIEQREITHTLTEREILATLADIRHPNLAKLYLAFQDIHRLYLVTDYYCGGDLATQMSTCMTFSKQRTLFYAAEMIEGIGELHRLGVLYRDLKPENILLTKEGHVVLTDFGLSKWLIDPDCTDTFCGTSEYLSPEMLTGEPYSFGIDHWSYGTILYEMLAGITPFWADNHMEMYRRVLEDPLEFPAQDENGLPEIDFDTADFLAGLLDRDPRTRLGAQGVDEIKSHAYFAGISWDDVYHQRLQPPYVPILTSHTDFANFDAAFLEMSPTLTPMGSQVDLTQDMQDVFEDYSFPNQDLAPTRSIAVVTTPTKSPTPSPPTTKPNESLPASDHDHHYPNDMSLDALVPNGNDDDMDYQLPPHNTFQPARKRGSVSMLSDVDSFHLDSPLIQHEEDERTIKRRNTHEDNAVGGSNNNDDYEHNNNNNNPMNENRSMDTMLSKKMTMTMTTDSSSTNAADDEMMLMHKSSLVPDMFFLDNSKDHPTSTPSHFGAKQQQQQLRTGSDLDQLDFGNGELDLRFSIQVNEKQAGFATNQTTPVNKQPKKQKYSTRRLLSPFIRF
ncbi:unnamed protein product [Absidia cylindrospora]